MLKEKIQSDLNKMLKERNETAVSTLRMALASVTNKEKEKKYKENSDKLTDEEVLQVLSSEAKKRKEAIIEFEKGGRNDLVVKEKAELEIIKQYLPEQLSDDELKKIVKEAIEKVGAKEIKDMGKIMAEVMPKIKGRADGSQVNNIAKDLLKTVQ